MLFKDVPNMLRIEIPFFLKPELGQGVCDKFGQTTSPWPERSGEAAFPPF
jgi:hypothetical protein